MTTRALCCVALLLSFLALGACGSDPVDEGPLDADVQADVALPDTAASMSFAPVDPNWIAPADLGTCSVCKPCFQDTDCTGDELCMGFDGARRCSAQCTGGDCPGNSRCYRATINGRTVSVCANDGADDAFCPPGYGCGTPAKPVDVDRATADGVCARWYRDRADLDEGSFDGYVGLCEAGHVHAAQAANTLRQVNLQRWLAGQPEVVLDDARNDAAQKCALIMHANADLDHYPSSSWTCYNQVGGDAAGMSNLATTPGVQAVGLYMVDTGNLDSLGHRRWILSTGLGPIGAGSTDGYSCMWVGDGTATDGLDWVAWPPPGIFPLEAAFDDFGSSIDETGWSIQSDGMALTSATDVIVTDSSGGELPVDVTTLSGGAGSDTAISFLPQGWTIQAGESYTVRFYPPTGVIEYTVDVVSCP